MGNREPAGSSRNAICPLKALTVMPFSIRTPHFPRDSHGGHLPVLQNRWGKYNDLIQLPLTTALTLARLKSKRKELAKFYLL